ncbi:MAG TPA: hypothetical protein ENI39_02175 [Anaerolineae bacterium]|nr:hypothetical protein [Anaerolineae bacterium]
MRSVVVGRLRRPTPIAADRASRVDVGGCFFVVVGDGRLVSLSQIARRLNSPIGRRRLVALHIRRDQ